MGSLNVNQLFQFGASEFVGTMLLILLGNGVVATCSLNGTKGKGSGWIAITLGWFTALFISVTVANAIAQGTGMPTGLLNPVFTINHMIINAVDSSQGLPVAAGFIAFLFQFLGAGIGQLLVVLAFKKQYDATEDSAVILGTFSTGPEIRSLKWNFVSEVIATFVFVFAISSIGIIIPTSNSQGALFAGLIIFGVGMSLGSATGYSLNPFRDLVPRLVHQAIPLKNKGKSDWGYSWVPTAGPIVGGLIALICAPGLFY